MCGAERLQVRELWHLMQFENPRAIGSKEDSAALMRGDSSDLGTSQLKKLPAAQPPLPSCTPSSQRYATLEHRGYQTRLLHQFRACELKRGVVLVLGVYHRRRELLRAAIVGKCVDSSILSN